MEEKKITKDKYIFQVSDGLMIVELIKEKQ
jgi:hypothetical protein